MTSNKFRKNIKTKQRKKARNYYYNNINDNPECARCGWDNNITIHHKDHDTNNNAPENLEPLCERCHERVHGIRHYISPFDRWTYRKHKNGK